MELHEDNPWERAWVDVSGKSLKPELVKQARKEEIENFKMMSVYSKVPIKECVRVTGKQPIAVRWVDINKQDEHNPKYRSSLVAKEIWRSPMPELYAATPPLECLWMVISDVMNGSGRSGGHAKKNPLACGVSRAYFYAPSIRPVFVKIVEEDQEPGDEEMCGCLNVSMHGTRDAALNWHEHYRQHLNLDSYKERHPLAYLDTLTRT